MFLEVYIKIPTPIWSDKVWSSGFIREQSQPEFFKIKYTAKLVQKPIRGKEHRN